MPGCTRPISLIRWAVPACALLVAGVAHAESDVVLVAGDPTDPVVQRVQSELELMGYQSEVVSGSRRQWVNEASERDAVAVVEVDGAHGVVVLWPSPVSKRERSDEGYRVEGDDDRVLALRAAELLNGRLASPGASDASGSTAQPASARPSSVGSEVGLLAGPAVTWASGGIPATFGGRLHAVWRPRDWLEVGALALVPVSAGTVSVSGGEAEARLLAVGAGAQLRWTTMRFAVGAGPHLLAARSWYDVTVEAAAFDDTSDARWAPRVGAGLSLAWRFHPRVALRGDAMLDAVLPPLDVMDPANPSAVQQARRQAVAHIGNPVATFSMGIEVELGVRAR